MFTATEEDRAAEPQDKKGVVPGDTQSEAIPAKTQAAQDTITVARKFEEARAVTSPAGQEVACMVQEVGFASVLVVDDIMEALERDPSTVSYVLRAVAWSKLSKEEQMNAMYEARRHREIREIPYRSSSSSKLRNSLCAAATPPRTL